MGLLAPIQVLAVSLRHRVNQRQLDCAARLPLLDESVANGKKSGALPRLALPIARLTRYGHAVTAQEFPASFSLQKLPNQFSLLLVTTEKNSDVPPVQTFQRRFLNPLEYFFRSLGWVRIASVSNGFFGGRSVVFLAVNRHPHQRVAQLTQNRTAVNVYPRGCQ